MAALRQRRTLRTLVVLACLGLAVACGRSTEPGPRQALDDDQVKALGRGDSGSTVRIAIIDGGIDPSHSFDLGVVDRWLAPGLDPAPSLHATQLAGIVAGRPAPGYSGGMAPQAQILDAKALDETGLGQPADVASALRWAKQRDADVVLTSLAFETDHPEVRSAVRDLVTSGATVVAASGNGFGETTVFPAANPGVLSVTAYDRRGGRLALAHWNGADVAAPGQDLLAPQLGSGLAPVSGTSVAAAVAAGFIAACGDHRPLAKGSDTVSPSWVHGVVTHEQRAVPRLACPTER